MKLSHYIPKYALLYQIKSKLVFKKSRYSKNIISFKLIVLACLLNSLSFPQQFALLFYFLMTYYSV